MAVLLPEPNKLCFLVWQTRVKNTITWLPVDDAIHVHIASAAQLLNCLIGYLCVSVANRTIKLRSRGVPIGPIFCG